MVNLLQVSVVLSLAVLFVVSGLAIYWVYYDKPEFSSVLSSPAIGGGGELVVNSENQSAPNDITLPQNVQILQNEINDTRYTAILITENLTVS